MRFILKKIPFEANRHIHASNASQSYHIANHWCMAGFKDITNNSEKGKLFLTMIHIREEATGITIPYRLIISKGNNE